MNKNSISHQVEERYREMTRTSLREVLLYHQTQQHHQLPRVKHVGEMPVFLSEDQAGNIEKSARVFLRALQKIPLLVFEGDLERIANFLKLPEILQSWVRGFYNPQTEYAIARPDGLLVGDSISFIEQNISSGVGGYAQAEASRLYFESHPVIRKLRDEFTLTSPSFFDGVERYLRKRKLTKNNVCLLDLEDSSGSIGDSCGLALAENMRERAISLFWADHHALKVFQEGVFLDRKKLSHLLRIEVTSSFFKRAKEFTPLWNACLDGRITMLENPFEVVLWDKMLLPFLSDPEENHFLAPTEIKSLQTSLPWTRFVKDYQTLDGQKRVSLLGHISSHKNRFVLKKGNSFLSAHVFPGFLCSPEQWALLIKNAVAEETWVVQEFIATPLQTMPQMKEGKLSTLSYQAVCSPYMIDNRLSAFLVRLYGYFRANGTSKLTPDARNTGITTVFIARPKDS